MLYSGKLNILILSSMIFPLHSLHLHCFNKKKHAYKTKYIRILYYLFAFIFN